MIDRVLLYLRLHPIKSVAGALTVVLFVAIAMGIYRKVSIQPGVTPSAPVAQGLGAEGEFKEKSSVVFEVPASAPDLSPSPAPSKPASLPPVAPIDVAVVTAARESWYVDSDSSSHSLAKAQFARVGGEQIKDALAIFEWPRAWGLGAGMRNRPTGYLRYRREGWIRADAEGPHTATLSIDSTTQIGGDCRLAVGDLMASTVDSPIRDGLVAGVINLRPGYYSAALECTFSTNLARKFSIQAALTSPDSDQPEILRFFELVSAGSAGP